MDALPLSALDCARTTATEQMKKSTIAALLRVRLRLARQVTDAILREMINAEISAEIKRAIRLRHWPFISGGMLGVAHAN